MGSEMCIRDRIISMDVGGKKGRTIEFDPETGMLEVRTVYKGTELI